MNNKSRVLSFAIAAGATIASLAMTGAAPAGASTIGGTATISNSAGTALTGTLGSSQVFTVTLPPAPGNYCSGDTANSGYHVWTYLVPSGTNVSSITFTSFPSTGYGYFDTTGYIGPLNTAPTTGQIINLPLDLTWSSLSPGFVSPGSLYDPNSTGATSFTWESGIACATSAGVVTDYWNDNVTFTKSATDPSGFTWTSAPGPATTAPELRYAIGLPIGGALLLGMGTLVYRKRRKTLVSAEV